MKRFKVIFVTVIDRHMSTIIEANSAKEAEEIAEALSDDDDAAWEISDAPSIIDVGDETLVEEITDTTTAAA